MSKKSRVVLIVAGHIAIALASLHARAATASASFSVSATVQSVCSVTASSMKFGTYVGAAVNASSTIAVQCTNSTPYNIGLSEGLGRGATVSSRKMIGPGSAVLGYSLKPDGGPLTNWGHTVGVDTVGGTGSGVAQKFSVLGEIPAGQSAADGAYFDTIRVTVTY